MAERIGNDKIQITPDPELVDFFSEVFDEEYLKSRPAHEIETIKNTIRNLDKLDDLSPSHREAFEALGIVIQEFENTRV